MNICTLYITTLNINIFEIAYRYIILDFIYLENENAINKLNVILFFVILLRNIKTTNCSITIYYTDGLYFKLPLRWEIKKKIKLRADRKFIRKMSC